MRLVLTFFVLALVAPFAGALPTPASPVCGADCHIDASSTGYNPLVATIATGSSVTFVSTDIGHVTRDVGVTAGAAACFEAYGEGFGGEAPPVRFDLSGTQLFATIDGVTTPCASAVATPAGAALPYFCSIHPTMRGMLIVTAV